MSAGPHGTDWKKLFNDFSGEFFFVYYASNFLSVLTNASSALLLAFFKAESFMKLNRFSSGSDASENNYLVLRLFFCLLES